MPCVSAAVIIIHAAITKAPLAAFRVSNRTVHRVVDVGVIAFEVVAAVQPFVSVEATTRMIMLAIAFVHAFIWWQTSFATKPPKQPKQAAAPAAPAASAAPTAGGGASGTCTGRRARHRSRAPTSAARPGASSATPSASHARSRPSATRRPGPDPPAPARAVGSWSAPVASGPCRSSRRHRISTKLMHAWEEWERGEEAPGKVLANMKTAGLPTVLQQLIDSGWTPGA